MNTISHALIPIIVCAFTKDRVSKHKALSAKQYLLIGLFGAAPDILNPHFTLAARYTSWSHSLWFWVILTIALYAMTFSKALSKRMFILLSVAYLTHLFCDAIAGGIVWNYPISLAIIGGYYISATWWIPIDVILILTVYIRFRLPMLRKKKTL